MAHDECHFRLRELPLGLRRRCVLLAIGLTWFAFSLFSLCIVSWIWLRPQPLDTAAIASLVLIGISIGISHGTHAKLILKDPESGGFVSKPGVFDFSLLALSSVMMVVGVGVALLVT
ncbi:MAG: hypothetical protein KDA69_08320 [Planctomycetaceae bacterium]|nr:hypothetical protein [Planctomycetaceae bacterium]MCA9044310.1 hypothetical protein [Planctomycetaceae bacterium]